MAIYKNIQNLSLFYKFDSAKHQIQKINLIIYQWAQMDSNHRPQTYKVCALTAELCAQEDYQYPLLVY